MELEWGTSSFYLLDSSTTVVLQHLVARTRALPSNRIAWILLSDWLTTLMLL